jgi:hypothetical protein
VTHRRFAATFHPLAVTVADEYADELTPFRTLRVPAAYRASVAPLRHSLRPAGASTTGPPHGQYLVPDPARGSRCGADLPDGELHRGKCENAPPHRARTIEPGPKTDVPDSRPLPPQLARHRSNARAVERQPESRCTLRSPDAISLVVSRFLRAHTRRPRPTSWLGPPLRPRAR